MILEIIMKTIKMDLMDKSAVMNLLIHISKSLSVIQCQILNLNMTEVKVSAVQFKIYNQIAIIQD
jgi:hypothetical protein